MDATLKKKLDIGFNPRNIVVVGDKGPNYNWLKTSAEYPGGPTYSVQLDENEIPGIEELGIKNFKSLHDIPEDEIDYVIIAVPRRIVPFILKDCIEKKVTLVACYTAGFAETHEEEGIKLSETIINMCKEADLAMVGPNCLCISNPKVGLLSNTSQRTGPGGFVGVLSMSGTHTGTMISALTAHGMPISKSVSMGNSLSIEQSDWLEYLGEDEETKIICMYLEGVRNGRQFYDSLKKVAAKKPVVILKGGQTADGARAATSHTASLASPFAIWSGMFQQTGAIGVNSTDEIVDVAKVLTMAKPVSGNRLGVIASTGGQSVLVSDASAKHDLTVPALEESSYEKLRELFTLTGNSYRNPLDVTGVLNTAEEGDMMLNVLADDPNIDIIAMEVGDFTQRRNDPDFYDNMIKNFQSIKENSDKPFIVVQTGMEDVVLKTRETLKEKGIPSIYSFLRGTQALGRAKDYYTAQAEINS